MACFHALVLHPALIIHSGARLEKDTVAHALNTKKYITPWSFLWLESESLFFPLSKFIGTELHAIL